MTTYTDKRYFAQRFGLWVAMVSITMMFAAFTSAYLVKRAEWVTWTSFSMPRVLIVSTVLILISSVFMWRATRLFKRGNLRGYRRYLGLTMLFGTGFVVTQVLGWKALVDNDLFLNKQVSAAFFYVISGAHAAHVAGGLVIIGISLVTVWRKMRNPAYSLTLEVAPTRKFKVDLVATYWHFVDLLWIYLFIFLLVNHP
jgi:cytochrome c oxidase subunit 3